MRLLEVHEVRLDHQQVLLALDCLINTDISFSGYERDYELRVADTEGERKRSEVIMTSPAPFAPIAELLERSLSIRHVYGEPVHHGDMTVIPVAQVAYGFGAGGGQGPGRFRKDRSHETPPDQDTRVDVQGAGGGGGVRMTPVGALEIGPAGTRFIRFHPLLPLLGAGAVGIVAGWVLARRR